MFKENCELEVDTVYPNGDRHQDRAEKPKEWVSQLVFCT